MATTLSTRTVRLADGTAYMPAVVRMFNYSTLSSGTTAVSSVYETAGFSVARILAASKTHAANSTVTVSCISGDVSTNVAAGTGKVVLASSGQASIAVATTAVAYGTFVGLNRFTRFTLVEAGGSTSQNVAVDVEFV